MTIDVAQIAAMPVGGMLTEPSVWFADPIMVVRSNDSRWLVRLGFGGVSLARSAERAMFYVRDRRWLAARAVQE